MIDLHVQKIKGYPPLRIGDALINGMAASMCVCVGFFIFWGLGAVPGEEMKAAELAFIVKFAGATMIICSLGSIVLQRYDWWRIKRKGGLG